MIDVLPYLLLGLVILVVVFKFLVKVFGRTNKLGIQGKLIWVDKGTHVKPFFNSAFEVLGKPDLMYQIPDGVLAVEYKSRQGPVFESDIVQAKCAALAARGGGYKVVKVLVKTATTEEYLALPKGDKALFAEIKGYVDIARRAKVGAEMEARPDSGKCRGCAFRYGCRYSV